MPTSVNFTTLQDDVRNYLERGGSFVTDPTVFTQIPRLINAAERKLAQILKLQGQIEVLRDPLGLAANVSVIQKPDRWRQTTSLSFGAGANQNKLTPLFARSYEYCRAYWPDDTATAPPEFYADYDLTHYLIVPTPDITYPLEGVFYMQPVLLDDANQNNFWTDYTPNMLLYETLLETSAFLKDDPRIQTWQGLWQFEVTTLGTQDLQKLMDRAAERNRP
jgi:hypothetical protein